MPSQGCADGETTPRTPEALEIRVSLHDGDGREVRGFRRVEPVTLVLTVRNRGDRSRSLTLPTSQTHEFVVSGGAGDEVWRWSAGRMFAQRLTEVTLAAGESRTFSETWDQVCGDGRPAAIGPYRLVGWIPALATPVSSPPLEFKIE